MVLIFIALLLTICSWKLIVNYRSSLDIAFINN